MSRSLGEQLAEALRRSQEKMGEDRPEYQALQVLKKELSDIVKEDAATPRKAIVAAGAKPTFEEVMESLGPMAREVINARLADSSALRGKRVVPSNTTPYSYWITYADPGDRFIAFVNEGGNIGNPFLTAQNNGKKLSTERVIVVHGPIASPTVESAVVFTVLPNESVQSSGNPDDGNADGSKNSV